MSSQSLDLERCKLDQVVTERISLSKRESEKHIPSMTPNDDDSDDFKRQKVLSYLHYSGKSGTRDFMRPIRTCDQHGLKEVCVSTQCDTIRV